jgi:N,N-dimethylformamidase beta subunit-like, C-terminal
VRHICAYLLLAVVLVAMVLVGGPEAPPTRTPLDGRAPTARRDPPTVVAAFQRESYAPGRWAVLRISSGTRQLRVQILRAGPEGTRTTDDITMNGVGVTRPLPIGNTRPGTALAVRIGPWPSGVYFARLEAADGRTGFAPFVVRPNRLGKHRVAVVLPTLTWQAYNLRDQDKDGVGDSWYACMGLPTEDCPTGDAVRLGRPFLNRGVPSRFRLYDLPFLRWLSRTHRDVDYLAQQDIERAGSAADLAKTYDLIVFPGHHEYVTEREYDLVEGYRDLGGNLMFLSANNYFWQVERQGAAIRKTKQWRDLGRPEAGLIGVQFRGMDTGSHRRRWILGRAPAGRWIFAGTGLAAGDKFVRGGIEIDGTTVDSPRNVQVLAEIRNLYGPGTTAQMTYYETARGAKVFAAGAFTLAGSALRPDASAVLGNLWARMANG